MADAAVGAQPEASPESKSKLVEQATGKGDLSYSYWAKDAGTVGQVEPKKLTEAEAQELQRQASSSLGASAWNAAGTFEERGATEWAKSRVAELVKALQVPDVRIDDVNGVTGDANIFIVRGKKRCGFDLELVVAWKATPRPGAVEVRGTCKVVGFASDDPDDLELQPEIMGRQPERRADEDAALALVRRQLMAPLQAVLQQLLEELKQR